MSNSQETKDHTIYAVPTATHDLGLGEVVVTGSLLDRLYDAVHAEEEIILLPLDDRELMMVAANVDFFDFVPTLLLNIPDVSYSILFEAQTNALPSANYDDLRFEKDKQERQKPAGKKRFGKGYETEEVKIPVVEDPKAATDQDILDDGDIS